MARHGWDDKKVVNRGVAMTKRPVQVQIFGLLPVPLTRT
jgi:hypothetical protein